MAESRTEITLAPGEYHIFWRKGSALVIQKEPLPLPEDMTQGHALLTCSFSQTAQLTVEESNLDFRLAPSATG